MDPSLDGYPAGSALGRICCHFGTHPDPAIKPTGKQLGNLTWNALFPRKTFGNVVARCLAKHQAQMLGRRTSLSTFLGSGGNALQTFGCRYCAQEMSRTDGVRLQWFYCLRMMEELDLRASRLVFGELVPPSLSMRSLLGPPHGPMTRSWVVFPEAECWMHTVNFLQLPPLLMAYSYQKTWQSFLIPLISLKPVLCSPTWVHQLLLWL